MPQTKFSIVDKFSGFQAKTDITNLPPGVLVAGSQNVLLNDGERVAVRQGFTLDGQANAALTPITSSYDWQRHLGNTRHVRSYTDELEYRWVYPDDTVEWRRLMNGFGDSVQFNYAEWWNKTEQIDELTFVNGSSNIYHWSGAITTYASATANTITKEGTTTWAEEGFYTSGTRAVVIDNIVYTYTGGEGTTTITGVAPNPLLGGHSVGDVIHQQVRTQANAAAAGLPATFSNDLIGFLYNQTYIGSFTNRQVYVSKQDVINDFQFASPRAPGEGAILTLDATPIAFQPQEDAMYIAAGKDFWYQTQFQLSADNSLQTLNIQRLKTTPRSATQSQQLTSKIKNYVIFVTNEPTLDTLGRLELIDNPQSINLSDPIKLVFDSFDFTNGAIGYFQNFVYIAVPEEQVVLMYNLAKGFWEAPQILPISRFSIIDGELYGHSSQVPETYKLFTGFNDNGNPINAIANFSYQQFGDRANTKNFNEFYSEGYITSNTTLSLTLRYNYFGCEGVSSFPIVGSDSQIICNAIPDGSFGKQSLGKHSLAGRGITVDESLPPKFRVIKTFPKNDFYELQVQYSSNDVDQRWELLAWGPAAMVSTSSNASISQ